MFYGSISKGEKDQAAKLFKFSYLGYMKNNQFDDLVKEVEILLCLENKQHLIKILTKYVLMQMDGTIKLDQQQIKDLKEDISISKNYKNLFYKWDPEIEKNSIQMYQEKLKKQMWLKEQATPQEKQFYINKIYEKFWE